MKKTHNLLLLLCFCWLCLTNITLALSTTDSLPPVITKNFKFNDGIYLGYDDFRCNTPVYALEELKANLVTNPQTFITQVEFIQIKATGEVIDLDSIWGLCLGGIPYIRLPEGTIPKPLPAFAGLQLRGNICYFAYEDVEMRKVKMPVYNPLHGIPYQTSFVERKQYLYYEKMLRFETGEIADLNVENLVEWVADDPQLVKAAKVLDQAKEPDKLFRCLLIYDDRHLVRIGKCTN
ncbi:MAG: hypothetical protein AAGG75_19455 [Bacteroidota bacterium]